MIDTKISNDSSSHEAVLAKAVDLLAEVPRSEKALAQEKRSRVASALLPGAGKVAQVSTKIKFTLGYFS